MEIAKSIERCCSSAESDRDTMEAPLSPFSYDVDEEISFKPRNALSELSPNKNLNTLKHQSSPTPVKEPAPVSSLLSLIGNDYDENLYAPKYSQAEFDAVVEDKLHQQIKSHVVEKDNQINKLNNDLKKKDAEIANMMKLLETAKEDTTLQKAQSKALSHRLQVVESELQKLQKEKIDSKACYEKNDSLKIAFEDISMKYEAERNLLKSREVSHKTELAKAVSEAKDHVYDKVKAQFEHGNKEFQKVKCQLKDIQTEFATKHNENIDFQLKIDALLKQNCAYSELIVKFVQRASVFKDGNIADESALLVTANSTMEEIDAASTEAIFRLQKHFEKFKNVSEIANDAINVKSQLEVETKKLKQLEEDYKFASSKLNVVQKELNDTKTDRDAQMTVTAKLITDSQLFDEKQESLQKELDAALEQCNKLKRMNNELITILEVSQQDP